MDNILDGLMVELMAKQEINSVLCSMTADMCDEVTTELQENYIGLDDVTGEEIDPQRLWDARLEELDGFEKQEVYSRVPRWMYEQDPEGIKVGVRWVDRNKGTKEAP